MAKYEFPSHTAEPERKKAPDWIQDHNKERSCSYARRAWFNSDSKFFQKIYVDQLFPSYVRTPSVLIGAKGANHNRMQSSGCTVQLRGRGCSQPNASDADEPQHILVKYDTEEQFEQFMSIFNDIVNTFKSQKMNRNFGNKKMSYFSNPKSDDFQFQSEVQLLWMFKLMFNKMPSIPFAHFNKTFSDFFQQSNITQYLNNANVPYSPYQLHQFIASCPHIVRVVSPDGMMLDLSNFNNWTNALVVSNPSVQKMSKEQLSELHHSVQMNSNMYSNEPRNMTCLNLILQALHFALSEANGASIYMVEKCFFDCFKMPLVVAAFGFPNILIFLRSFPQIFAVRESDKEIYVEPLANPNFGFNSKPVPNNNMQVSYEKEKLHKRCFQPNKKSAPHIKESRGAQPKLLGILGKLKKK